MNTTSPVPDQFVVVFYDEEPDQSPYKVAPGTVIAKGQQYIQFVNITEHPVTIEFVSQSPFAPGDYTLGKGEKKGWEILGSVGVYPYNAYCGEPVIEAHASRPIIIIID